MDGYWPDPGHHLTLRQKSVAYETLTPFFIQKMRIFGDEAGNLGLNGDTQQLPGSGMNDIRQRIR